MAESQNWQIDEESKTNLAVSLSQFMFKNQFNENPVKPRFVPILTVRGWVQSSLKQAQECENGP